MFAKLFTVLSLATLVLSAPVTQQEEKRVNHDGTATYFEVGLGACGWWNGNSDHIVALNSGQYQQSNGGNCGQALAITNTKTGITVEAYVADECPTCGWGDLDLSPSLFAALNNGNYDDGVFPISWHFHKKQ